MSGIDAIWLVAVLAAGILFELVKVRRALEHIDSHGTIIQNYSLGCSGTNGWKDKLKEPTKSGLPSPTSRWRIDPAYSRNVLKFSSRFAPSEDTTKPSESWAGRTASVVSSMARNGACLQAREPE